MSVSVFDIFTPVMLAQCRLCIVYIHPSYTQGYLSISMVISMVIPSSDVPILETTRVSCNAWLRRAKEHLFQANGCSDRGGSSFHSYNFIFIMDNLQSLD